jgi:hypothetical protein
MFVFLSTTLTPKTAIKTFQMCLNFLLHNSDGLRVATLKTPVRRSGHMVDAIRHPDNYLN